MKNYKFLYIAALIVSLSGMLAGFDTGVISGAILFIDKSFEINDYLLGLIVSSVSLGAIVGAFVNGFLVNKIGRKPVLVLTSIVFILASILSAVSKNAQTLIFSRFLIGSAVGAVSICAPMYLSEISTKEKRGQIVSFYQLFITFGILFSYLINYYFANFKYNWRLMLACGAVLGIALFLGLIFQKDTPRYYVLKEKFDEAKNIIKKLNPSADTDLTINEIKNTIKNDIADKKLKFEKYLIYPFIIGIGLMAIQVATGINAIIYYAPLVFQSVGFKTESQALFVTIFIGLINFFMTFVAIKYSDKIGRKPLLFIGLSGMTISLIILAMAYQLPSLKVGAVIACGLYIVSFSMSLGPMAFLIISEVFPLVYRGLGMASAILTNFFINFLVTGLFPVSLSKLGGTITFSIFILFCIAAFFFIYFIVPETKNKSLEEIEQSFKLKSKPN